MNIYTQPLSAVTSIKRHCLYCNSEFTVLPYFINTRKFCSRVCSDKGTIRRVPKIQKIVKNCLICDTEFTVFPSQNGKKYCSLSCKHDSLRVDNRKERKKLWWESTGKLQARIWYRKNKRKLNKRRREARRKNKENINARQREKMRSDIQHRLRYLLRGRLTDALKRAKSRKYNKAIELLGCTILEFKQYIEQQWTDGMNWDNHSLLGWHIDHIRPCNTFDLTDPEQQRICFHYSNLRPLWYSDNLSRPKDGSDILNADRFTEILNG
jgi:hypothetical protein